MLLLAKYMLLKGRGLCHVECWYVEFEKDMVVSNTQILKNLVTKYISLIS